MISSCCTFRLNRRSALSMDSPSCTFTSAKLEYTPLAADFLLLWTPGVARRDQQHCTGLLDPSEYVRLSQVFRNPRRNFRVVGSTHKLLQRSHLKGFPCAS